MEDGPAIGAGAAERNQSGLIKLQLRRIGDEHLRWATGCRFEGEPVEALHRQALHHSSAFRSAGAAADVGKPARAAKLP